MKHENKAIAVTSIIAGVVLVIAILAIFTFNNALPNSKNSVTVEGVAEINANPDLISVYYNIESKADTSSAAKEASDEIYNELISEISIAGFDRSDLKTQGFNVYPNRYWEDGSQKEEGYIATHSLKLELEAEDFENIGNAIDAGVNAGAGISYINFELSSKLQSEKKAEALELASKDAKVKAEAVASGFDKNLGKLVSVGVSDFGYQPWRLYTAESSAGSLDSAEEARAATTSIEPGEKEISARVTATYKLR